MATTPIARGFELEWRHRGPGATIAILNYVTRSQPGDGCIIHPCGMLTIYREPGGAEHRAHDIATLTIIRFKADALINGKFQRVQVDADPDKLADELAGVLARDSLVTDPWVLYVQQTKT